MEKDLLICWRNTEKKHFKIGAPVLRRVNNNITALRMSVTSQPQTKRTLNSAKSPDFVAIIKIIV